MEITWTTESGNAVTWEVHKCDPDEWINSTMNDDGLYKDITEEVDSHFKWVVQGNTDTLFCIDVDSSFNLHYYIGYLK